MTLTPAYGRDYKSKAAVLKDFNDDKDFVINDISSPDDGRYANKSDLQQFGPASVNIRYQRLTKVAVVEVR